MDSTYSPNNFSNNINNKYGIHYIELASENGVSFESNIGQFYVTYITPNIDTKATFDTVAPKNPANNVLNVKDPNKLGITEITNSNYVTITVPKHLFYVTGVYVAPHAEGAQPIATVVRKTYPKGTKFLAVNANGVFNDIQIIGVVDNG